MRVEINIRAMTTYAQALAAAQQQGLDRLDAQLLLLHTLGKEAGERAWLLTHTTATLTPSLVTAYGQSTERRAHGEPLAYLVGHQEFFGLDLHVNPHVLIPRPDTETLVEWALAIVQTQPPATSATQVLDLGTGSGAIALALKHTRPELQVTATDSSAQALAVAHANATRLGLPIVFGLGSWFGAVEGRFDVVASNPPYIAQADPHLAALTHEPMQALTAGTHGLDALDHIIHTAPPYLKAGGWLLLEHGYDQAAQVRSLLASRGFAHVASHKDLAGIERCSGGQWQETT